LCSKQKENTLEKLGLNLGYLLLQITMFAVIFVTLRAWVFKPILKMLDKRKQTINQGLEDARLATESRANAEQEAQKVIAEAQAKANQIVREASERAETAGGELKHGAETEAARLLEQGKQDAEAERNRLLGELRGDVAALAISAAQKILAVNLDEQRQHALINEFFSGVKSGKVSLLEKASLAGDTADVTSALPLTEAEQATVKKDIISRTGGNPTINYRVDPSILGGLVVKVGDTVLDGSVVGQLQNLKQNLK
jgi:F-type H+-transporting ATPase subunit b